MIGPPLGTALEKFEEQRKDLVLNMCVSLEDELTKEIEMDDKSWDEAKKRELADGVVSHEFVQAAAAENQMQLMRRRSTRRPGLELDPTSRVVAHWSLPLTCPGGVRRHSRGAEAKGARA